MMSNLYALSVAQKLRNFILLNHLQAGDRLPTHDKLCQRLKVGLRPLREGLSILVQQGIVETRRRGGTVVNKPSVSVLNEPIAWQLEEKGYTFEEMVRARAAIESVIVAEAARARTARDLLLMLEAIERMELQKKPNKEAEAADEDFHLAVLGATHNHVMNLFGLLIAEQFKRKSQENLNTTIARLKESTAEHREIYRNIEKGNAESARKIMHEHILRLFEEKR
jgi:GntR family transcriptional regulator, transcriptional repressor for pyruvate dehydrogenase complex